MKTYDFDRIVDRHGTNAVKYDALTDVFGRKELLPLWVADMDFATPDFILDALRRRLDHPVLGYTQLPDDYWPQIAAWIEARHGWRPDPAWMRFIPGIVKGIGMAVLAGRKVLPHIGVVDNQDIVDLIHAYPGRFTGMAGGDPSDGPGAMEELERYVVGEGLRGIVMEPGLTKTPMFVEDERIFPLYERCQALGVPVMLMVGSNCGPDIEYSKPEHAERVAKAFPKLNIILSHGGWPWVTEAIHVAYRYKNVYLLPDLYQFNGPGSGEYLAAANYILRDQMLFGSAYPYVSLREAVDYFLEGRLRPEAQPAFLAGNARRILELERV